MGKIEIKIISIDEMKLLQKPTVLTSELDFYISYCMIQIVLPMHLSRIKSSNYIEYSVYSISPEFVNGR